MDFSASTGLEAAISASSRLAAASRIPFSQTTGDPAPPPSRMAPLLAESIHECSRRLMTMNDRLAAALERLAGPMPFEVTVGQPVGQAPKAPVPDGALPMAQFGVTLVHKEIDRTRALVERLEEIA